MGESSDGQSRTLRDEILKEWCSSTPSRVSGDGPWRSAKLDGPKISKRGVALALAARSRRRATSLKNATLATSGPSSAASSRSESRPASPFQLSLESKLQARLAALGSPMYELTWGRWDMKSGGQISRLLGRAVSISGKDSIGWPTPGCRNMGGATGSYRRLVLLRDHGVISEEERRALAGGSRMNPDLPRWLMGYKIGWHL